MKKSMLISLFLVGATLGIMLAFQFRSNTGGIPYDRPQALTQELSQINDNYNTLLKESNDLEKSLQKIEGNGNQSYATLNSELKKVRFSAGLEDVTGAGVEVKVENVANGDTQGYDPNLFSIKYEDILRLINELRAAGAVAISINGQRIVTTSEVRSAGNFIDVNLTRLSAPYIIKAVGDPEKLDSSLNIKGGLVETLKEWSIQVSVKKMQQIIVPAYKGLIDFNYAKTIKEGGNV